MLVTRSVLLTCRVTVNEHHLVQILSLVKAATVIRDRGGLKLVLDGTHYEFVGCRFVGHFLRTNASVSLLLGLLLVLRVAVGGGHSLLLSVLAPIRIDWNSAFEVENVALDS